MDLQTFCVGLNKIIRDAEKCSNPTPASLKVKDAGHVGACTVAANGTVLRRLAFLIGLAAAYFCLYGFLQTITVHPCWYTLHCTQAMLSQKLGCAHPTTADYQHLDPAALHSASPAKPRGRPPTNLSHIVFGIASTAKLWSSRSEYIKLWWRPKAMRGYVWLDQNSTDAEQHSDFLPSVMISPSTSHFKYTNKNGRPSVIRISRIVSDTFRLGLPDVHWFVMGDDDTVFVPDNLVRVLSKYDHRQYYYIGSNSESHLQNLVFSYSMAYGGGGFAISYPLAKALEQMQDGCLERYPDLYGGDHRIQACMAELGVPLTKEPGFHQYDIRGNLFGLMTAHPLAPLVSLHHLDMVEPVFPNRTRLNALQHLQESIAVDPAAVLQQSICYDSNKKWSISVSWGFAVLVYRGIIPARELEMPLRTFLNWQRNAENTGYALNTRPFPRHPCQKPFVFYMQNVSFSHGDWRWTESVYTRDEKPTADDECRWNMASPEAVREVRVAKQRDDKMWRKGPRRRCCGVMGSSSTTLHVHVGVCKRDEIIAI